MNAYFPQFRAMWMAENATNTLHNVLTLRGAQVRDRAEMGELSRTRRSTSTAPRRRREVPGHHWPMWGNAKIVDYWKKQRDLYKYIHDQSVNLMNKGYTGIEISNMVKLPPELDKQWYNRGYYGTRQARHARRLSALHGLLRRQSRPRSTSCRRRTPRRSTSSTWAAPTAVLRRPRRTSTRASIAGSPKPSSTWSSPIPNNKDAKELARRRL